MLFILKYPLKSGFSSEQPENTIPIESESINHALGFVKGTKISSLSSRFVFLKFISGKLKINRKKITIVRTKYLDSYKYFFWNRLSLAQRDKMINTHKNLGTLIINRKENERFCLAINTCFS